MPGPRILVIAAALVAAATASAATSGEQQLRVREYPVPSGTHPHDVAPARDGGVWYTAQGSGELGWLNPKSGQVDAHLARQRLGSARRHRRARTERRGSPTVASTRSFASTPRRGRSRRFPLPASTGYANLNTATFDRKRRPLVHGSERDLRAARPEGREGARVSSAARRRAVRDHARRRRATSTTPRSPAATSAASTRVPGRRRCSDRRPRDRARGGRGRTRAGGSGSASGTPGKVGMYDPRARRGASGAFPGRTRRPTPSTSTSATRSG